jgi:hypothetical protein
MSSVSEADTESQDDSTELGQSEEKPGTTDNTGEVPQPAAVAEITSVADLLTALRDSYSTNDIIWYRGHEDASWTLTPSLARPPHDVNAEQTLIKRFKQNAFRFLQTTPADEWDWLFLMQHYGVATRLLDWTESPLVALWFAIRNVELDDRDGCIWGLSPKDLNEIARLKPRYEFDIPAFGVDRELDSYLPTELTAGITSNTPAAAIASRRFERIYAQFGVFTITHKDQDDLRTLANPSPVKQFAVPKDAKSKIRDELRYLRITELTVFPGLENVGKQVNLEQW